MSIDGNYQSESNELNIPGTAIAPINVAPVQVEQAPDARESIVSSDENPVGAELVSDEQGASLPDLLKAAKEQFDLAFNTHKKCAEHVWLMGKFLTDAKGKHAVRKEKKGKNEPNWEVLLKEHGISVSSDYRARLVFKTVPILDQISGLRIMDAYEVAGIPKAVPNASKKVKRIGNESSAQKSSVQADSPNAEANADDGGSNDDDGGGSIGIAGESPSFLDSPSQVRIRLRTDE